MADASGVEIPKGSPDDLRSAAHAWKAVGATLEAHAGRLDRAASSAVGADWQGPASTAYSLASGQVTMSFTIGASACERAASACRRLSAQLREAQHRAKEARRLAERAIDRRDDARRRAQAAQGRITAASTAAENAAHRAATAAAAGPTAASALSDAHDAGRAAAQARDAADRELREAEQAIGDAEHDLRAARRDGEEANRDAARAGRDAAQDLASVAAEAQPVPLVGVPVPVSLRDAQPDGLPTTGDPFHGPGRFGSPGEARAAQIEQQERARRDAADDAKPRKGTILDGLAGLTNSATLGIVDLGGDKDSERYRGGDLAGYIPITPAGVGKDLEKIGAKIAAKQAEKKAAKEAEEKAAARLAERQALARARRERFPGESVRRARERIEREERELREELARKDFKRSTLTDIVDHLDKVVNMLIEHRVPGLPDVLTTAAKDWPTVKASALYLLDLARGLLRR